MSTRLPTALAISALVRLVDQAGGSAMVLARGDRDSGAVLLVVEEADCTRVVERGFDAAGRRAVVPVGPAKGDAAAVCRYWARRHDIDPDLWVVELRVAEAERLAAETIYAD